MIKKVFMFQKSMRSTLVGTLAVLACAFVVCASSDTVYAAAPTTGYYLYDGTDLAFFSEIAPGSSIAVGDIDKDGEDEIVVGSPPGVTPKIIMYELNGSAIRTITPYGSGMTAGLNVAIGNVTGYGNEIISVPRRGAGPHILRFSPTGQQLSPGFFAYSERFHGGVNLATADINGDGKDEIITGAGPGGGAHVRAFRESGQVMANILPEQTFPGENFKGGVVVGGIDYDGDGNEEVVIAPQSGRVADIKVFEPQTRVLLKQIRAFGNFAGGVSLATNNTGGGKRVVVGAAAGGGPHVLQYSLQTGAVDGVNTFPFESSWHGGVEVAFVMYDGGVKFIASAGSRYLSNQQLVSFGADDLTSDATGTTGNAMGGVNSQWIRQDIATEAGTFSIQYVKANLTNSNLRIRTLTGSSQDCDEVPCVTRSLQSYVQQVNGFAGINGSYFCPADYSSCVGKAGSFYWMWYNTMTRVFSNLEQNKYNSGPVIAFDTSNNYYYYRIAGDWPGKEAFESTHKTTLRGVLSNGPGLMFEGSLVVSPDQLDDKQRTVKSNRSGIGFKGDYVYMVVASGATVQDLGYIMKSLSMEHAMNLDGGGSSSLYYDGQYRVGPGRNLPNAFVLTED